MKHLRLTVFKSLVVSALCLLLSMTQVFAAPYPEEGLAVKLKQADGSVVQARVFGDEYYAETKSQDGYPLIKQADGFWYYATPNADGSDWVSTGQRVQGAASKQAKQKPDAALKQKKLSAQAITKKAQQKHKLLHQTATPQTQTAPGDTQTAAEEPAVTPGPPSSTTTGNVVGLTVLVDFSDDVATIKSEDIKDFVNQPSGYTKYGNACSVHEYFRIQSGGKLNYTNMVTAYYALPNRRVTMTTARFPIRRALANW